MQPMARRAWLYMCAAVSEHLSGQGGGARRTTTLYDDATEYYCRPSRIRSAPTYPIPDV